MQKIDNKQLLNKIKTIDANICKNIDSINPQNRGFISQNILSQLRNFCEIIMVYCYAQTIHEELEFNWDSINKAQDYLKSIDKYHSICKFHELLQITSSHYTQDEADSERLMLKHIEALIKIKKFLNDEFHITILHNISKYPIDIDPKYKEYYKKIYEKIKLLNILPYDDIPSYKCYIQKKKTIILGENIFYEFTLSPASNKTSKFDRIIAFSEYDIMQNYAVDLKITQDKINIINKNMPISIIAGSKCSIRPCEFKNLGKVFGIDYNCQRKEREYRSWMQFITSHKLSLLDVVLSSDKQFESYIKEIYINVKAENIKNIVLKCREIIYSNQNGSNILRLFLYNMNNAVITDQIASNSNSKLSNMYLLNAAIPFDNLPFTFSLKKHNFKLDTLLNCIPYTKKESDFLAHKLIYNAEQEHKLYTNIEELNQFKNIDDLIESYNSKLWSGHFESSSIKQYKKYLFINGYESDCRKIIESLINLSQNNGFTNNEAEVSWWLDNENDEKIDDEKKITILKELFLKSKIAIIYGAAGTGKTTMIKYISNYYCDSDKLYITNTNPALDNLKNRIKYTNCDFSTIAKVINSKYRKTCDILFIDECSTVSNRDMVQILERIDFQMLILVGDVYQIESIYFGNWFDIAKGFLPKNCIFELEDTYRTNEKNLLDFWTSLRLLKDNCYDKMIAYGYTSELNDTIFNITDKDEIILCLSYDGLYGVNNVNRFLQEKNSNNEIVIGLNTYKIGDPILFNDSNRFYPTIHNNMKGSIYQIIDNENNYLFQIELAQTIKESTINYTEGLSYIGLSSQNHTIVQFAIDKEIDSDNDEEAPESIIPFQVSYAVSIHKAQGLEYNSVKIVITNDVTDRFSHNIFYTAVTRAKKALKIYASPESLHKIFENFNHEKTNDVFIFSSKFGYKYKLK